MCFKSEGQINSRARMIALVKDDFLTNLEKIVERNISGDIEKEVLYKLFRNCINNITSKKKSLLTKYIYRLDKKDYDVSSLNDFLYEIEGYLTIALPSKFAQIPETTMTTVNPAIYRRSKQERIRGFSKEIDSTLPREIMETKIPLN